MLGAGATYHFFGRGLEERDHGPAQHPKHRSADDAKSVLNVINHAGGEAFGIAIGAIPMLILALLLVNGLRDAGVMEGLRALLDPIFRWLDVPTALVLPIVTKYIAGGTAMMGVTVEFMNEGLITAADLNRAAGFLIHPLDIAGIAILISAGPRVASVLRPALLGGLVAIGLRSLFHYFWFP